MPPQPDTMPSPYSLNYIAAYYRNYAIFSAMIALGLDMLGDEVGSGRTVSGVKYDALPGIPHDIVIVIAGAAFLFLGLLLCGWNAATSLRDMMAYHSDETKTEGQTTSLLTKTIVIAAVSLGVLIPYGFAMMGLRVVSLAVIS